MEHTIKEEGILEFKALVMSKGMFKQCPQLGQAAMERYLEGKDPWEPKTYVGYVIEPWSGPTIGQTTWFVVVQDETLKKVRDVDLFWIIRSEEHPQPTTELTPLLRQVFTK